MKKVGVLSFVTTIIVMICSNVSINNINAGIIDINPVKIGVLLYKEEDDFISVLKNDLLKIENENKDKVDFIFYDGKDNQELQNQQIDELINMKVDAILLDIVDITKANMAINKMKENNIPVVLFNREPLSLDGVRSYGKALYVGTEACEAGNKQGQMIISEWDSKDIVDRNGNNVLDYILLHGDRENLEAINRSKCVIKKINENEIKTDELALEYCNWEKQCAKDRVESLILRYGNDLDLIISNNDEMAIGAIKALQQAGYNKGDPNVYIPVVGVDGIDEARKLIKDGFMTGTVIQNHEAMADALYIISMNLAKGSPPLKGTNYKFDESGVAIRIPYGNYITRTSPNL